MIDSTLFFLLVPGFFLVLGGILLTLAVSGRQARVAGWGAAAFFLAGIGSVVDLYRPAGDEWLKWATLAIHFAVLLTLSMAFLARKKLDIPMLALAATGVIGLYFPLFGVEQPENVRTGIVQLAAFVLTASVVFRLRGAENDTIIDRFAVGVLGLGALSYLGRAILFWSVKLEDSAGRFFDDFYNVVFHFISAGFGFLAGLCLLVAIGIDNVLLHARRSAIDPLTGLGNRRALNEAIDSEGERKWRCGGVIVVDMDHFKSVNDEHGHLEGDRLLVAVSRSLTTRLGGCGHLCRVGGEEFLVLVDQEHRDRIEELASVAHAAIAGIRLDGALEGYRPTASVGFHSRLAGMTLTEAIRLADQALYRAKSLGRDRVVGARHANGVTVMTETFARTG